MTNTSHQDEVDFLLAMGEEFGRTVCPPVIFDDAAPNECCEAIHLALGDSVTPELLASLRTPDFVKLAEAFGNWFECEPPEPEQIAKAVAGTLFRWPIGSLND